MIIENNLSDDNDWYVCAELAGGYKPFVNLVQKTRGSNSLVSLTNPNDLSVFNNDRLEWGIKSFEAVSVIRPELWVKSVDSN